MTVRVAPLVFPPADTFSVIAVADDAMRRVAVLRSPNEELPETSPTTRHLLEQHDYRSVEDLIGAEITTSRCFVDQDLVQDFETLPAALTYADELLLLATGGREPREDLPDDVRAYLASLQHRMGSYGAVVRRLMERVQRLEQENVQLEQELQFLVTRPVKLRSRYPQDPEPEEAQPEPEPAHAGTELGVLELGARIEKALREQGISSVEQLAALQREARLRLAGIGEDSDRRIDRALGQWAVRAARPELVAGRVEEALGRRRCPACR